MSSKREDEIMPVAGQRQQPGYEPQPRRKGGYQRQSIGEAVAKSFIRSIASSLGRILVRTLTGRMR